MEASHKTHRPHMKVGKDEEKKKTLNAVRAVDNALTLFRVWPFKNLGLFAVTRVLQCTHGCGKC